MRQTEDQERDQFITEATHAWNDPAIQRVIAKMRNLMISAIESPPTTVSPAEWRIREEEFCRRLRTVNDLARFLQTAAEHDSIELEHHRRTNDGNSSS